MVMTVVIEKGKEKSNYLFPKYEDCIILMVNPNDTIGAIKAYISEKRGIALKKQRNLSQDGEDLSNVLET
ncbi:hypothetical protein H5410_053437 [Solanum commersonii]|uniref:Ubiquitin-like domain-containing protein n=1 Tax=Solanum commersonii TaxID=4109 RepID=A0A9J5X4G1_SOLCO|nr:hypothetical protein H5410_053437 [Solanum commersonii]